MKPTEQTIIDVQLFAPADAEELPEPVDVEADLMGSTNGGETVAVVAVEADAPVRSITVGVLPVWGIALGWVLAVVLGAQAVKRVLKAFGLKERHPWPARNPLRLMRRRTRRHVWRRWMYVVPIGVGTVLSVLFGPALGESFGLRFGLWTSLLILGPGSGAAAAFAYDVLRGVVLPVLPATVIGLVEKITTITLPESVKDKAKLSADTLDSEVVGSSDVEDDDPDTIPIS